MVMGLWFAVSMDIAYAKIQLKPMITVNVQRDSNFFRTEINEREVHSYSINPSINLSSKTKKAKVGVNYGFSYNWYDYQDPALTPVEAARDMDNFTSHDFTLHGNYLITPLMTMGLGASYNKTIDEAHGDELSNSLDRREYDIYRIGPNFKVAMGKKKHSVELGYTYTNIDYAEEQYEDSTENRFKLDLNWNWTVRQKFDLQYHHWQTGYSGGSGGDGASDYQANQIQLFYNHQFQNFSLDAGIGYQLRTFDDNNAEDLDGVVGSFSVESGDLFELLGKKAVVTANIQRNMNATDGGEGYFTADRLTLTVGYNLIAGFESSFEGVWQRSNYENGTFDGREDDHYDISAIFGYKWRWLTAELKGGYEWRNSNWDRGREPDYQGYDFDNTYIAATLSAGIDTSSIFGGSSSN
jgi:hypothetical protein